MFMSEGKACEDIGLWHSSNTMQIFESDKIAYGTGSATTTPHFEKR